MTVHRWLFGLAAATFAVVVLVGASAGASAGDASGLGDATCSGGSIAPGVYSNLNIAGVCTVDAGSVKVKNNLTVLSGGTLIAAYGGTDKVHVGSNLNVLGNLYVLTNGILVLGCEPVNYICYNDPDQKVGTYFTRDTVGGSLIAEDALAVVAHLDVIGQDVTMTGGGGGVSSCSESLTALNGAPPYGDFEDMIIGGNLTITGWQSCWLGVARDAVAQNVDFNDNLTGDPDGNEIVTDSIRGNLNCAGNSPSPQIGDSAGSLDNVFGHAHGQCANASLVR
jgi:hypothetical protein